MNSPYANLKNAEMRRQGFIRCSFSQCAQWASMSQKATMMQWEYPLVQSESLTHLPPPSPSLTPSTRRGSSSSSSSANAISLCSEVIADIKLTSNKR